MPSPHCSIKTGKAGNGGAHAEYIAGVGKYAEREDVLHIRDGNMPSWAQDGADFFAAADTFERANGRAYTEIEAAIPRAAPDPVAYAVNYADRLLGKAHPYRLAVHDKPAADGGRNVHMHLMFSERVMDGIERDREQFFKRAAAAYRHSKTGEMMQADPAKGGAKKDRTWHDRERVQAVRDGWQAYAREHGIALDLRSNAAKGQDAPEPKLGPQHPRARVNSAREQRLAEVIRLREMRQINAELHEISHQEKQMEQQAEQERKQADPAALLAEWQAMPPVAGPYGQSFERQDIAVSAAEALRDGLPPGALMGDEERQAMRSAGWLDSRDDATPKGMAVLRYVAEQEQQKAAAERDRKQAEQERKQAEQQRQDAQERQRQEEQERQAERDRLQAEQERKQAEQQDAKERQRQERERRNEQMLERDATLQKLGWEIVPYGGYEKAFTFGERERLVFLNTSLGITELHCAGRDEPVSVSDDVSGREVARLIDQQAGEMAAKAAGVPQQARIAAERTERPSTDSVDKPAPPPAQPAPTRQDAAQPEKQALQPPLVQRPDPPAYRLAEWWNPKGQNEKKAWGDLVEQRGMERGYLAAWHTMNDYADAGVELPDSIKLARSLDDRQQKRQRDRGMSR